MWVWRWVVVRCWWWVHWAALPGGLWADGLMGKSRLTLRRSERRGWAGFVGWNEERGAGQDRGAVVRILRMRGRLGPLAEMPQCKAA